LARIVQIENFISLNQRILINFSQKIPKYLKWIKKLEGVISKSFSIIGTRSSALFQELGGGLVATFLSSYGTSQRNPGKTPEQIRKKGSLEGVAAPEAANNAGSWVVHWIPSSKHWEFPGSCFHSSFNWRARLFVISSCHGLRFPPVPRILFSKQTDLVSDSLYQTCGTTAVCKTFL